MFPVEDPGVSAITLIELSVMALKMSRPRREPEDKSLRAAAKSPPTTLGRLPLPPRLAIAVAPYTLRMTKG